MTWYVALYLWGVVASSIVNNTKSLLALWYAKTEDKDYYNKFKEKSVGEKITFFAKNILKTFIPVYNIIHPIKMLLDSNFPSLFHPIRTLKDDGRRQLAIWQSKEAKAEANREKISGKFHKISNWFNKTKDKVKAEKEKMLEEKKEKSVQSSKQNVSESKVYTIEEVETEMASLSKEYVELKKQLDKLRADGASTSEKNKIARKINEIAADYKKLDERRSELKSKQAKQVAITKPVTTKTTSSPVTRKEDKTTRSRDTYMAQLKDEYNKLRREYNSLKVSGASEDELNAVLKKAKKVTDEYNRLLTGNKSQISNTPAVQNNRTSTNNNLTITVEAIDNEIQKLMAEQTMLERKFIELTAKGVSTTELKKITDKREINSKRISYLMSYRKNLTIEDQPTSGCMTLRR